MFHNDRRNPGAMFGEGSLDAVERHIEVILEDGAASHWFRGTLKSALERNPVDALNDAEQIMQLLRMRFEAMMKKHGGLGRAL